MALTVLVGSVAVTGQAPAGATTVGDETALRAAFADPGETSVELSADVTLTDCGAGAVTRVSATPVTLDGKGRFSITQTCADTTVLLLSGGGGLTLKGTTLVGGDMGVEADGSSVVESSRITGQTSDSSSAGGIAVTGGSLTLTDTLIDGITATFGAIGAAAGDDELTATRVTVTDISGGPSDSGLDAVAVGIGAGTVTLIDSVISDVDAGRVMGALSVLGPLTMFGTTIRDLTSDGLIAQGILSAGDTTVIDSSITDLFGTAAVAIMTASDVTVVRSTIARIARESPGIGIYVVGTSDVQVSNSTISAIAGAAIFTLGNATVVYSTISDSGTSGEGVEFSSQLWVEGSLVAFGSVVVQNAVGSANCQAGSTSSAGYNFSDDTSCGLTATSDRQGVGLDALLSALGDNGGPGPTRLPMTGSPLLDAIPVTACQTGPAEGITVDERELPRPAIGGCDIGAVEIQPEPEPEPEIPRFTG